LGATPAGGRHLGGIIVAQRGTPIQITFRNNLPATHILPVDTTIPSAELAQNRIATHLHGGFVPWISDGGPMAWWSPTGVHGESFVSNAVLNPGAALNEAEVYYPNDQSARLMWYHDHAMGITRLNAYAGVASAYIIRDGFEAGLRAMGLPDFIENGGNEIPIVVQDKIFVSSTTADTDPTWFSLMPTSLPGHLWYEHLYKRSL
jgi:FtsP/CotA-like multicopper oxidase with cupredoxin domain